MGDVIQVLKMRAPQEFSWGAWGEPLQLGGSAQDGVLEARRSRRLAELLYLDGEEVDRTARQGELAVVATSTLLIVFDRRPGTLILGTPDGAADLDLQAVRTLPNLALIALQPWPPVEAELAEEPTDRSSSAGPPADRVNAILVEVVLAGFSWTEVDELLIVRKEDLSTDRPNWPNRG